MIKTHLVILSCTVFILKYLNKSFRVFCEPLKVGLQPTGQCVGLQTRHERCWETFVQVLIIPTNFACAKKKLNNPIVSTGQARCYNNSREIPCPKPGQPFYRQDAQYEGNVSSCRNNRDGTVTDLNTGLMWSKAVNKDKVSLIEAKQIAQRMTLGGYSE